MENREALENEETVALKESMSFVIGKKLPIPKNWSGEELDKLEFPEDLSKLTIQELGSMLGIWTTVMAYAQYEVARMDIEKTARGNKYEFTKKKVYIELLSDSMIEEQRKAEAHVRTAKLQSEFELAKAKYILANALLGAYSKYYQALSRELSRRGLDGAEKPPVEATGSYDISNDKARSRETLTKTWGKGDSFDELNDEEIEELVE